MSFPQTFLLFGILFISLFNSGCDRQDAKVYTVARETPEPPMAAPQAGGMQGALPPGHPSMGAMPGEMPMGGNAGAELNIGTPPPAWKVKPPTPMRLASFEVDGEKGTQADISLILLGGAAGGILDNVNRWQSQLGQPALTAENLAQKTQRRSSPLGEMTVVDLQGLGQGADATKDGRIVAAMVSNEGMTYFFKMRGNAELVGAQKDEFIKWVGAVRAGTNQTDTGTQSPASASSSTIPLQ